MSSKDDSKSGGWKLLAIVGAGILAVLCTQAYLAAPADPPGRLENPKLAAMFNEGIEAVAGRMVPEKSRGYSAGAKDAAKAYIGRLKSVVQYRKLKRSPRPNSWPAMYLRVVYEDGSVFDSDSVGSRARVSASGVRLEFDHGKVVSAQTDGAELDRTLESARLGVEALVEDLVAIDKRQHPELYYKPAPAAPSVEQNRQAWK